MKLTIVLLLIVSSTVLAQSHRIENEYKLSFPCEKTPEIWEHLKSRYERHPKLTAVQSVEYFKDIYFDTNKLDLLSREGAVRRRYRLFPDEPTHKKHKRSLVQIKLRREHDKITNRSEIKFGVRGKLKDVPESTKPQDIVKNQKKFEEILEKEAGLKPESLALSLVLNQIRRRVYLSKDGAPFATITEDEVTSSKWLVPVKFCEVELELNEILYTSSNETQRNHMQEISDELKSDLTSKFPFLVVDQTPKYNKAFNVYQKKIPFFESLLKLTHGIL